MLFFHFRIFHTFRILSQTPLPSPPPTPFSTCLSVANRVQCLGELRAGGLGKGAKNEQSAKMLNKY